MSKTRLMALFVEGNDDERFVKRVVIPRLGGGLTTFPMKYAEEPPQKVNAFIESICKTEGSYLFFADIDEASCVTAKKAALAEVYPALSVDRIVVVCAEIEAWYYAGLPATKPPLLRGLHQLNTDHFTKEACKTLRPTAVRSRVDFLIELLKVFSFEDANQRNTSFGYFCKRHKVGV
jgi:hypothetical protein